MEYIPASHAIVVGRRYPAVVLDLYHWGVTLYFDLSRLAPGRSPKVNAVLLFAQTVAPDRARSLSENDRIEVVVIGVEPGNPTASLPADTEWLTWNNETVRQLARHIRETREYILLPVLADALEDAGCADTDLLEHCREFPEERTQSWVVELLATQA